MDIISILKIQSCFQSYIPGTTEDIKKTEKELSLKFTDEYKKYI